MGRGCCHVALQSAEDREKYRETVLRGCLGDLSYDLQSEGTRANYVYGLTRYFEDRDYFLIPCIEAYEKIPRRDDFRFAHITELLLRFAEDGSHLAKSALQRKYDSLLGVLIAKKSSRGYDFERDNFERICIALVSFGGADIIAKIAADMGRLFEKNPKYSAGDFDWFCFVICEQTGKKKLRTLLSRAARGSRETEVFYRSYLSELAKEESVRASREDMSAEKISSPEDDSPYTRVRFIRRADAEQRAAFAAEIHKEPSPEKKAEMLIAFSFSGIEFPKPHGAIIEYSKSENAALREAAAEVLVGCRSDEVLAYAKELLPERGSSAFAIEMLIRNYTEEIRGILSDALSKIRIGSKDTDGWHGIVTQIVSAYRAGIKLPKEFILFVYDNSLCSFCRESAVRIMAKHRWLGEDIIAECRFDSNESIVRYINRYYRK